MCDDPLSTHTMELTLGRLLLLLVFVSLFFSPTESTLSKKDKKKNKKSKEKQVAIAAHCRLICLGV